MGAGCGSACLTFGVSAGVSVPDLSGIQDLPEVALVLWSCVPAFLSALSLCLWYITLEYGSTWRFKGVFSVVCGVRVGLCRFGALLGLWGFCTRVELGGLKACGVFASLLSSFLSFCSYVCLLLCSLSFFALVVFLCPLALSLWLFGCGSLVSFSLADYTQKERAQRFVPCVLSCPAVSCFIWLLLCIPHTRQVSARLYR